MNDQGHYNIDNLIAFTESTRGLMAQLFKLERDAFRKAELEASRVVVDKLKSSP